MELSNEQAEQLVAAAVLARKNAYAPFSEFAVGAAVLAADGRVFPGVNVENSSYGVTICAERVAFCTAVAAGVREFVAVAVATDGGAMPCGACRQFMHEFGDELEVLIANTAAAGPPTRITLAELLPAAFRFEGPEKS